MKKSLILAVMLASSSLFAGTRYESYYMKPVIFGTSIIKNLAYTIYFNKKKQVCIKHTEDLDTLEKTTEAVEMEFCRGHLIANAIRKQKGVDCELKQKPLVLEGKVPYGFKIVASTLEGGAYSTEVRELDSNCRCAHKYSFKFMDDFGKAYSQFEREYKCLPLHHEKDREMVKSTYQMSLEQLLKLSK